MKLTNLLKQCFTLLVLGISWPLFASSMTQSQLPMSQFNFQGFVPDSREARRQAEEDPNLIRLLVDPSFYWAINRIIDRYQETNPSPFRIHQGTHLDLEKLLDEGLQFDILVFSEMARAHEQVTRNRATEARVLAIGRMGLWAPLESARSLNVLRLQKEAIGLAAENSVHYRAAREVLERQEMLREVENRLKATGEFEDLFERVRTREIPIAFLPWQRLVEGGIDRQRDVLKLPDNHHSRIVYAAALTNAGNQRANARSFWDFLFDDRSATELRRAGFD